MNPFLWLVFTVLDILFWILIIQAILSWLIAFNIINHHNQFVRQLNYSLFRITEPLLRPIRRILPELGGLDFSPIVLLLGINFLKVFIQYYF